MLNNIKVITYDIGHYLKRRKAFELLRTIADGHQASVFALSGLHTKYQNLIHQLCNLLQQHDLLFSINFAPGSKSWQLRKGRVPLTDSILVVK
jgi:CRISPR/Cas system-associated endoribonuclease Cas2